jgi:hypothetical protein
VVRSSTFIFNFLVPKCSAFFFDNLKHRTDCVLSRQEQLSLWPSH